MKKLILTAAVALVAFSSVPANARVTGDPLTVEGGQIEGIWTQGASVRAYLGVPFAAPPVGDLRWVEPQPVVPWEGVRAADQQPNICMQTLRKPGTISIEVYGNENLPMSEDCLYLNVWTPADAAPDAKLPVFFWIHGGGSTSGSAAKPEFNGEYLAKRGIVVVSINYRLNLFGYFGHPDLTAESPNNSTGNYGALDQVAALKWARENIAAFGGDPDRITIAGQSAGGSSVNQLMSSPLSQDLIAGGMAQSSGVGTGPTKSMSSVEGAGVEFSGMIDASVESLRAMPADVLLAVWSDTGIRFGGPNVDGYFLTKSVIETWEAGEQASVPYSPGWSAAEFNEYTYNRTLEGYAKAAADAVGEENVEAVTELYGVTDIASSLEARAGLSRDGGAGSNTWNAAELQSKTGAPTYMYYWSAVQPFWDGQSFEENSPASLLGAYHGSQVPYVFGTLDLLDREFGERDRELVDDWGNYIVNFVSTGNPNGDGLAEWPEFNAETEQVLEMGLETSAVPLPNKDKMEFFRALD